MFLAEKSLRSYVGLYKKFLHKRFSLLLTPPPPITLLTNPPMQQRLRLGQGEKCSMILKKLRPSTVVSAHLPNVLLMQRLDDLSVSNQSQVTLRGLSYEDFLFSSAAIPRETLHCAKRFVVFREEVPYEGLFDKEPAPPPSEIKNSTAQPSDPGEPIEGGVFNASNQAEDISLVRNQGLEVDDEI